MNRTVYCIVDRDTDRIVGSYCRSYHERTEFGSVQEARSDNVHGLFEDVRKYRIAKYRVTYELIDGDCE